MQLTLSQKQLTILLKYLVMPPICTFCLLLSQITDKNITLHKKAHTTSAQNVTSNQGAV